MARRSKLDYNTMVEMPAFAEMLAWMEQSFERPHLDAKPPSEILPNYGEVYAATAAQYRVIKELKLFLDKRTSNA